MPRFTPPYDLFFAPSIAQAGGPGIADRADRPPGGGWYVHLASNRSGPSSASVLRSFGVQSQPVDNDGRPRNRNTELRIETSIYIRNPFFFSTGAFASARTAAVFSYVVEEFDERFRFLRTIMLPGTLTVVQQDFWWFGG